MGAGIGAAGGAGVGYLASKGEPADIRKRNMLVGGATGAGIGALAGGLSAMGGVHPSEVRKMTEEFHAVGKKQGWREAVSNMPNIAASDPEIVKKILLNMDDKARDSVIKSFDKGWLARWLS